jgi:glycine cleavage system H lipoate-binding protein
VAGEIVEVNHHVEEHLEYLSRDPWGTWMIRIKPVSKSLDGLMDAEAYEKSISQAH